MGVIKSMLGKKKAKDNDGQEEFFKEDFAYGRQEQSKPRI